MGEGKGAQRSESNAHIDAERGRTSEEVARIQAKEVMERRVAAISEWMNSGNFPMRTDNVLLGADDEQVRAYISARRVECEPIWERNRLRLLALRKPEPRGEKGIPE